MSYPRTVKDRFLQLRAEGKSYRAIAAELHVGRSTLLDWGRQFQADIDALRAIRIEALKEQYQLLYHHQVQLLAKQIQTVRDMLNRCDLSDMPANKLLDMQLKLLAAFQKLPAVPPVESMPVPDDFTDPDDQTLPPDLTTPIPAHPLDPDPETETKTQPKSDRPTENHKLYGNSNATYEVNMKGAISPPKNDRLTTEDPDPLQTFHALQAQKQRRREYEKYLETLPIEDLIQLARQEETPANQNNSNPNPRQNLNHSPDPKNEPEMKRNWTG